MCIYSRKNHETNVNFLRSFSSVKKIQHCFNYPSESKRKKIQRFDKKDKFILLKSNHWRNNILKLFIQFEMFGEIIKSTKKKMFKMVLWLPTLLRLLFYSLISVSFETNSPSKRKLTPKKLKLDYFTPPKNLLFFWPNITKFDQENEVLISKTLCF